MDKAVVMISMGSETLELPLSGGALRLVCSFGWMVMDTVWSPTPKRIDFVHWDTPRWKVSDDDGSHLEESTSIHSSLVST